MIIVSFSGTTGKDAEVRYTTSGKAVWSVSVASNYGWGENKGTIWFKLEAWDKSAEAYGKWGIKKGQKLFVSGELQEESWTNKEGIVQKSLKVRVIDLDGGGAKAASNNESQAPVATRPARNTAQKAHDASKADGYAPSAADPDDDIPF